MRRATSLLASLSLAVTSVLLGLAACSPAPPVDRPAPLVAVPPPDSSACAPGDTSERCAAPAPQGPVVLASCVDGTRGPKCDGVVGAAEEKALSTGIDAAHDEVIKSAYANSRAIVELARLELRRDGDVADADGPGDAARALKNAMRAVAVDDTSASPRIVLALARARSLAGSSLLYDPSTRGPALSLVDLVLRAVPPSTGVPAAAAKTLEGYVALERGDRARAKSAFEAATQLDPGLGSAWVGLGDAARSDGAFDAAASAYKTAAVRLPDDPAVRRALESATRRETLLLPTTSSVTLSIDTAPLAPSAPPVPECPASVKSKPESAKLCRGLADLAKASTRDDQLRAAKTIIEGWNDMQALCTSHDPACGAHVAAALAAAGRGFQAAGHIGKSIAAAKMVLGRSDLPGAPALLPALCLEIGDRYFAIGVFDVAADFYARYLDTTATQKGPVARRTLALRIALANTDAAQKLAGGLAADAAAPPAERAAAVLATAGLIRLTRGPEAAVTWITPHKPLVDKSGPPGAVDALSRPVADNASPTGCSSLLACAVRRLAGEPGWNP